MHLWPPRKSLAVLLACMAILSGCEVASLPPDDPVEGWAVLAEKDDYDRPDMPDLLVHYVDTFRMRQALERLGWAPDHIHEIREFDSAALQQQLDWLEQTADGNDLALLYVTAHGNYLSDVLLWDEFVPAQWGEISSERRLLMVDACTAASFTSAIAQDPTQHLSIAAVGADEFGWKGLEEEGLPIVGGVFTYYFVSALGDPEADIDADGAVSVQEAARLAEAQQRAYMHDVVLVVPEFVEMFHALGVSPELDPDYPRVVLDDTLGEPLFLALGAYH